jgi:hypothetical protein
VRRLFFFWLLLAATCRWSTAIADDTTPNTDNIVQEFSGGGTTTTGLFKVQDGWEVRWNARQVVSVAVMSADGTIVAGAAGVLRGSLFVPLGGQYYLKVSDGTVPPPTPPAAPAGTTNAAPTESSTNAPPAADTNAPPSTITNPPPMAGNTAPPIADTNAAPVALTNAPPAADTNAAPAAATHAPPAAPTPADADTAPPIPVDVTWHLQIVQLGASVAADQALTVYTPFFIVPDSAVTPVATPVELPPPVLTDDQAKTVVTIKGDKAQGFGFLMRSPEGTFVVTHLHLLAGNPNVTLTTGSGVVISTLALKGATDRDLAMFAIQDNQFTYLPSPSDTPDSFQPGDQLIIPDVGAPSEILLGKPGRIVGTNAERIDFDNPMGPGNTGSPVIHVKSGTVLGLVTAEKKVDLTDTLAKAWAANPAPGSASIIPYYGLRLGGVQTWETYDPDRFLQETTFLGHFHQNTRCLDSYLNGRRRRSDSDNDSDGPPDNKFYLASAKLRTVQNTYRQFAGDADQGQRLEGARELLFDLEGFADTDLATLRGMTHLYAYDQAWAQEEIAYRLALKKELDQLSDNIVRMDNIARSR